MSIRCPKCEASLSPVTHEGVQVERCEGCSGLWVDARSFERLLGMRHAHRILDTGDPETGREMDRIGAIPCPNGHVPKMVRMVDHEQTHVWYERCPVCHGTWLDAGELTDLAHDTIADFFRDLFRRERR